MTMDKKQAEIEKLLLEHEKEVFKELKKSYTTALADIKGRVLNLQNKLNELNAIDTTGYNPESLEILQSMKQSKIYQLEYQKALEKQINSIIDVLKQDTTTNIRVFLNKMYQDSYLGIQYYLNSKGIPMITPLNQSLIIKSIEKEIDKMTFAQRLNANMNDFKKTVKAEITRGIANGSTYKEIAQQLSMKTGEDLYKSKRIARTEGGRVSSEAKLQSMRDEKEKGADIVKQWDSTLDGKTRYLHRELDGQIAEVGKPFKVAGMEVEAPNMFGLASEDVNCRCVVLTIPRWDIEDTRVKYDNEHGELIETKNYNDWKQGYYRKIAEEELQEQTADYFKGFVEAKTRAEAEKYAQNTFNTLINHYDGLDIKVANEINRTLTYYQNKYPEVMENIRCLGNWQTINQDKKETMYYYYKKYIREKYPNASRYEIEETAKKWANQYIKRIPRDVFAASSSTASKKELEMYMGIYVNSKYGKNYDIFSKALLSDVETLYHPQYTGTIKATIDHEMAHQLDKMLGISNEPNIQRLFDSRTKLELTNELSSYSWDNTTKNKYAEMIAEGWSEYLNNPNPRPIAKEIGETIERKYAEWIKKNS